MKQLKRTVLVTEKAHDKILTKVGESYREIEFVKTKMGHPILKGTNVSGKVNKAHLFRITVLLTRHSLDGTHTAPGASYGQRHD